MDAWFGTTWTVVLAVALTTLGVYVSVMVLTRLAGLRSFSKMSSFDFAVTVAIGSAIASTILLKDVTLARGAIALAVLYGVQIGVSVLRQRSAWASALIDNRPLLLMAGRQVIEKNLRKARITKGDLRGKLREANVIHYDQIRAVVMEATGDVSVLHASPDDPDLEPDLFEGVSGSELLFKKNGLDGEEVSELKDQ